MHARWLPVLTIVLACGCMTGSEPRPGGPTLLQAPAAGYAPIWVNTDLAPIRQPTAIGSVMVGVVTDHGRLFLVGIEPATGRVLWRQAMAIPPDITPGVSAHPARIGDDKVAYYRPYQGRYTQLVVASALTGAALASSPMALFTTWPFACENGTGACTLSHGADRGSEYLYRLDPATGDFDHGDELPPRARLLAPPNLVDLVDRPENTIAWLRDGELRWRTSLRAAFPPGFSSDNGWYWSVFADEKAVVGSVFGEPRTAGETRTRDLARDAATAGISIETGDVLWRDDGTTFRCMLSWIERPVRCRSHGTRTWVSGPTRHSVSAGIDVTLEGFEPRTGRTTWSLPLGPAEDLIGGADARIARAGPEQLIIRGASGPVLIDLDAGTATTPPERATYWCLSALEYQTAQSFRTPDGSVRHDRTGGDIASPCDARGEPAQDVPGADSTLAVGARVGDYAVVAIRNGYVGFRLH